MGRVQQIFDKFDFRVELGYAIERGVTEEEIARRLETSVESVQRWREGKTLPHPDYMKAIVAVLNKM